MWLQYCFGKLSHSLWPQHDPKYVVMVYKLSAFYMLWLRYVLQNLASSYFKIKEEKFLCPMTEWFIKINDISRTCNICRKEHLSNEIHLWSISVFTVRQVTSALKKKTQQNQPTQICSGPLLLHQHENIPRVHLYTTRKVLSHTHPLTQTLLPLHACTQTLHSHVKLLTRNQSSKLWRSLTQTQTCFIPSPALEKPCEPSVTI